MVMFELVGLGNKTSWGKMLEAMGVGFACIGLKLFQTLATISSGISQLTVSSVSPLQFAKALSPIELIELGIVTELSETHCEKASSPMYLN